MRSRSRAKRGFQWGNQAVGDHRGVVGPVFEEMAFRLDEFPQLLRPVAVQATEEGEVMGPRQDIDGVHLYEPQPLDERQQ